MNLLHRFHHAIHRHHHHAARHHAPHFSGFAFGGRHGSPDDLHGAFGRGRKLGSADLQLLLLALLAEQPSHGYELIKALDERSNGYYVPSPGMVYPALTYLEEIGHASVEAEGTKKRYTISEAGLDHVEKNRAAVDALLGQLAWIGKRMGDVREAMQGRPAGASGRHDESDFDDPASFRGRGRHAAGTPEVRAARRNLKSALIEKSGATLAEQKRIAAILERAAAEIREDGEGR
jgi:DNA-binding PadR family transcriptional regulator